jgi:glycogen phosphorylase
MRESMARLTPQFSTNRTLREYTEQYYIPAAAAYRERAADRGAMGVQMVNWQQVLAQNWFKLRFGEVSVATDAVQHLFEVQVYLNGLDPNAVRVELYADGVEGSAAVQQELLRGQTLVAANGYFYSAQVPATRPAFIFPGRRVLRKPLLSKKTLST